MRLSRKLGLKLHIHLLDVSGTASYSFGVLWIVFGWCMGGVGLVVGRPTPIPTSLRECGAYVYDCSITGRQDTPGGRPPGPGMLKQPKCDSYMLIMPKRTTGPSDPSWQNPSHPNMNLVDPVNISLATISAIAGVLLLGTLFYRFYSKWSILGNNVEPLWPPPDAARDEIMQLVELIRMGMIDARGAPPHVINWVFHGVNAPWPPPGGVESLQRWRWGHRYATNTRPRRDRTGRSNIFTRDGNIELPPRAQHWRSTSRPFSATTVEPLPLYVRDADLDANHYSITVLPPDFPPLPPDLLPSALDLEFLASPEVHRTISTPSSLSSINDDEDSEIESRGTTSLRGHDDTPLTGLTPRPPPPAILL